MDLQTSRAMGPAYSYSAHCKRVIDGDTIIATVDLGFYVSMDVRVRIHGVNAPEHDKPGGQDATDFLKALIGSEQSLLVESYRDRRSFERWVCDVYYQPNGTWENVGEAIITAGHGVPYP